MDPSYSRIQTWTVALMFELLQFETNSFLKNLFDFIVNETRLYQRKRQV